MMPTVIIKRGKEDSILRKHPWVFSGAVHASDPDISQGQVVYVKNREGHFLGMGHYQHGGSIVVRMLTFSESDINQDFWNNKIKEAYLLRNRLGLPLENFTNIYRLVHGEGDFLPGLVIDIYKNVAVIQCHSIGMYLNRHEIARALEEILNIQDLVIYVKAKDTLPNLSGSFWEDGFIKGSQPEVVAQENGYHFYINIVEGQKTGFFIDQRDNRKLLSSFSHGKSVLNTFCYTGGFSVYALMAGATRVDSVDISGKAMALTEQNVILNGNKELHQGFTDNVLQFLQNKDLPTYEIVVVDPPAFAKTMAKRHNAVQAYKRLNVAAIQKIKPGGFLFTFSCSQVVNTKLFHDTIVAAGLESGRNLQVIQALSQGGDHPVNLFHPEGHYLKGLVVHVN